MPGMVAAEIFYVSPTPHVDNRYSSSLSLRVLADRYVAADSPRFWRVEPFIRRGPLFGATWLRCLRTTHESAIAKGEMRQVGKWTVASLLHRAQRCS